MKRLLHKCPITGKETWWIDGADIDEAAEYGIYVEQDVEPILDFCAAKADDTPHSTFRHAAEIPLVMLDQALREGWAHDEQRWKRWLNDRDNFRFRSWGGRL